MKPRDQNVLETMSTDKTVPKVAVNGLYPGDTT